MQLTSDNGQVTVTTTISIESRIEFDPNQRDLCDSIAVLVSFGPCFIFRIRIINRPTCCWYLCWISCSGTTSEGKKRI